MTGRLGGVLPTPPVPLQRGTRMITQPGAATQNRPPPGRGRAVRMPRNQPQTRYDNHHSSGFGAAGTGGDESDDAETLKHRPRR